jgi:hypothetical protein
MLRRLAVDCMFKTASCVLGDTVTVFRQQLCQLESGSAPLWCWPSDYHFTTIVVDISPVRQVT